MLTFDLLIANSRSQTVQPRYVDADSPRLLARAAELTACFQRAKGLPRGELKASLDELTALSSQPLMEKGWIKLLFDRCTFELCTDADLIELRRSLFEASARAWEVGTWQRELVLAEAGRELSLETTKVEDWMYADLKDQELLATFKPLSSARLLHRYNTALAQAVLFKAQHLRIELGKNPVNRVRDFFRALKFHRLLHQVSKRRGSQYLVELDGPLSLFGAQSRYGVRMACLLPHLLKLKVWRLDAELSWGPSKQPKRFQLDEGCGLRSHVKQGSYLPVELQAFARRFGELSGPVWQLDQATPLVDLGEGVVVVPDFRFKHVASGLEVDFEIMGYWRRGNVVKRLESLRKAGLRNYLLGVAKDLQVEKKVDLPEEVYRFRQIPNAQEVRKRLDRLVEDTQPEQGTLFS